jgi:hypothetical protein
LEIHHAADYDPALALELERQIGTPGMKPGVDEKSSI